MQLQNQEIFQKFPKKNRRKLRRKFNMFIGAQDIAR
jgi:hypothetical protein